MILSIRPHHAEAILEGRKTVELRRRRVAALPGTAVLLYATRPTGAVVGMARVRETICCSSEDAWRGHAGDLAIDRLAFDAYMAGASIACLLVLEAVARVEPVTLETMRSSSAFQPPQSYRFVSPADPSVLRDLVVVLG